MWILSDGEPKKMWLSVFDLSSDSSKFAKFTSNKEIPSYFCLTWNFSQGGKAAMWNAIVEHI